MLGRSTRKGRRVADLLARLFLGFALLALVLLGVLPNLGWYRTETVLSGSMKPPKNIIAANNVIVRNMRGSEVEGLVNARATRTFVSEIRKMPIVIIS